MAKQRIGCGCYYKSVNHHPLYSLLRPSWLLSLASLSSVSSGHRSWRKLRWVRRNSPRQRPNISPRRLSLLFCARAIFVRRCLCHCSSNTALDHHQLGYNCVPTECQAAITPLLLLLTSRLAADSSSGRRRRRWSQTICKVLRKAPAQT